MKDEYMYAVNDDIKIQMLDNSLGFGGHYRSYSFNKSLDLKILKDIIVKREAYLEIKDAIKVVQTNNNLRVDRERLFEIWYRREKLGESISDISEWDLSETSVRKYLNLIAEANKHLKSANLIPVQTSEQKDERNSLQQSGITYSVRQD